MTDEDKKKTDEAIKKRMDSIFPSPEVAAQVVNLIVSERPHGWSKHSNAPYYKKMYADQIRGDIDKMIDTGKSIIYYYAKWCNDDTNMTKNTLYQRINQSIRYLIERLDTPDKRYAQWYEKVNVHRTHPEVKGVLIEYVVGMSDTNQFHGEEVVPRADTPVWKRQLDKWLESDSMQPYIQEGLILSQDEVHQLKVELGGIKHVAAHVNATCVKVIKMTQ